MSRLSRTRGFNSLGSPALSTFRSQAGGPRPSPGAGLRTAPAALLGLCLAAVAGAGTPPAPPAPEVVAERMASTPPSHPRLLFPSSAEQPLRERLDADPTLSDVHDTLLAQARALLAAPPVTWPGSGRVKLHASRTCLARILRLAYAWRMTGEPGFADRARVEMLHAAAFPDWNPGHYLDTAEMTAALAIGYDWLYGKLDPQSRDTIRAAIVGHGLRTFKGNRGNNNWNQVCNGGMLLGALAVWEDERELAAQTVARALADLPIAMAEYAPDGNYPEAPIYWGYGTTYNVLIAAACTSALGTDFGISEAEGFTASADYYRHMIGPTGLFFNYSDCGSKANPAPLAFWFAKRTGDASLLWNERKHVDRWLADPAGDGGDLDRFMPLIPLWWQGPEVPPQPGETRWAGRGRTPVASFRTNWDPDAVFVAVKGGSPSANHGHMDVGSFVMDADGVRWAEDLGAQSYGELERAGIDLWNMKQESGRWTVFRIGSSSHNILTVDGQQQRVGGSAPLVAGDRHAIVNLDSVYTGQLALARRGVRMGPNGSVLVQDEVRATLGQPATVRWAMLTRGIPDAEGNPRALLERDGRHLLVRVLAPEGVALRTCPSDPPPNPWDAPNRGTRILGFELTLPPGTKQTIAVELVPGGVATDAPPLPPLAAW